MTIDEYTRHPNPRNLTFSQAQGYEGLPGPLALGEISEDARLDLWDLLHRSAIGGLAYPYPVLAKIRIEWRNIAPKLHRDFSKIPLDQFDSRSLAFSELYRKGILEYFPFNRVFDFLQIVMRHDECPPDFVEAVQEIFESRQLAYRIDTNGPPTILPMATKQEGEAISEAISTFQKEGLGGPETHLRQSAEHINQGNWSDSIRESVHAVESIARILAPKATNSLKPALDALERKHPIHPALKLGFERIYGYTSDEEGIRHPLLDSSESPSGRDEAVFMLGSCASFASYLWRIAQNTEE